MRYAVIALIVVIVILGIATVAFQKFLIPS